MNYKISINIIFAGLSILLIGGGFVWFSIDGFSIEPALSIISGLITFIGWLTTRESEKDQAKDKEEIIREIRVSKQNIPVTIDEYTSDAHRETDKKLLAKCWNHLKDFDNVLSHLLYYEFMNYNQYENVMWKYYELRREMANQFINQELEQVFTEFDTILAQFRHKLSLQVAKEQRQHIDTEMMLYSHGKLMHLEGPRHGRSYQEHDKIMDLKDKEWRKLEEEYPQVKQALNNIIRTIKLVIPEFEFS